MIDSDLARLYEVETRILNQAVKRNIKRFPVDFMLQLSKDEAENLRSQIATSNSRSQNIILKQGHNIKYLPYAFTENGVAMLSSVLRSKTAIEVNIRIMRAFTAMRSFLMSNAHIFQRLETVEHNYLLVNRHLSEHDRKFEEILTRLDDKEAEPIEGFFYEGQIFDAYTLISDLYL
ncbi:MAG: ORF6N domain-containing protein [Bacteroidales bacterium]|nr:ORF6N domain-containing protein [Bacteroidales bacterium]